MIYYLWTKFLKKAKPRDIKQSQKKPHLISKSHCARSWFFIISVILQSTVLSESSENGLTVRDIFLLRLSRTSCILEYCYSLFLLLLKLTYTYCGNLQSAEKQ